MLRKANPVLWITLGLPAITVVASFLMLGTALRHPDNELPEQYHWEGLRLDRDFARAEQATALGVRASFQGLGAPGRCGMTLVMAAVAPDSISLALTHGTRPALDQRVEFRKISERRGQASYVAECRAAADGHWRAELSDPGGVWSIRQNLRGSLSRAALQARASGGD